jgi:hypothetical protein
VIPCLVSNLLMVSIFLMGNSSRMANLLSFLLSIWRERFFVEIRCFRCHLLYLCLEKSYNFQGLRVIDGWVVESVACTLHLHLGNWYWQRTYGICVSVGTKHPASSESLALCSWKGEPKVWCERFGMWLWNDLFEVYHWSSWIKMMKYY